MGRVLIGFVLFVACLAFIVGAAYMINGLVRRRKAATKRRKLDATQRDLATYAPAVLNGDPLLDIITSQGKQLETVRTLLRDMTDSHETFVHRNHQKRINAFLAGPTEDKES